MEIRNVSHGTGFSNWILYLTPKAVHNCLQQWEEGRQTQGKVGIFSLKNFVETNSE